MVEGVSAAAGTSAAPNAEVGQGQAPVAPKFTGTATHPGGWNAWKRPKLSECTPEDFMLDFMRFCDSRGDDWETVWDTLDNSLRRSGRPMDALALYKEICSRGGFISRESAKRRIRMPDVFKSLHNYYVGHTYTDIGNNMLNTYERWFLPYEKAHPEDIIDAPCTHCQKTHEERWGGMVACDGCGAWYHHDCCAANTVWRSKVEMVTSYLCLVCTHLESRGMLEVPAPAETAGEEGQGGRSPPRKKMSRKLIDEKKVAKLDEYFERHVSMTKRRGRKYDPNYPRPMRQPDGEIIKGE